MVLEPRSRGVEGDCLPTSPEAVSVDAGRLYGDSGADASTDGDHPCMVRTCKRASAGRNVCDECYADVLAKIRELSALYDRLDDQPLPPIESVPQKPSFESKSPANDHVLALRDWRTFEGPIWTLARWSKLLWWTRAGIEITPNRDFRELARGARAAWPLWARSSYAGEFADDIGRIWRELSFATGDLVEKRPIGLCECGSMLFWVENLTCDVCGRKYANLQEISLRKAVLTYELLNAPFWKTLIRRGRHERVT